MCVACVFVLFRKSYHLNISRIIWKPNFRIFFLSFFRSIEPYIDRSHSGCCHRWHFALLLVLFMHTCGLYSDTICARATDLNSRNQEPYFPKYAMWITTGPGFDWLKINETKANKYTITHQRSLSLSIRLDSVVGWGSQRKFSWPIYGTHKKNIEWNLPIFVFFLVKQCPCPHSPKKKSI